MYNTHGRTVTEVDSVLFATLTGAHNPLFLDQTYAAKTQFGSRIVPGLLTASLCTGLVYQLPVEPFGEGFVGLVGASMKWTKAIKPGNTIRAELTVGGKESLEKRQGLVTLRAVVLNEANERVLEIEYRLIVRSRA